MATQASRNAHEQASITMDDSEIEILRSVNENEERIKLVALKWQSGRADIEIPARI